MSEASNRQDQKRLSGLTSLLTAALSEKNNVSSQEDVSDGGVLKLLKGTMNGIKLFRTPKKPPAKASGDIVSVISSISFKLFRSVIFRSVIGGATEALFPSREIEFTIWQST